MMDLARIKRGLAVGVGVVLLVLFGARAPLAAAEPALWEVRGPVGVAYLFGSVHLLREARAWETPKIAQALAASDELWLEIADPGDAAAIRPLVVQLGLDPQVSLSSKLSAQDRERFIADVARVGGDLATYERFRPWLAALSLPVAALTRAGYAGDAGVDVVLRRQASARGLPIKAFETAEQQLRLLAGLPEPLQMAELHVTLEDFDDTTASIDRIARYWMAGDVERLFHEFNDDMRRSSPDLYRTLIVERNQAFAKSIAQRLRTGGTAFVAVGAGHLAGPEGVPELLRKQGLSVRRL